MSDCDGFAVTRQIKKHVLIAEASSILVLDEWVTVCIKLDFAAQNEVHTVGVITTPVENIALLKLHISQAME